jgi:uncharacterized delta-60 repeat protein
MKKKTPNIIPLIATAIVPTATLASVLAPPPAHGATGDLDPGFGAVGRLGSILNGPAWSLDPLDDGTLLLAGGGYSFYYYYYYSTVTNFVSRVTDAGAVAATFRNNDPANIQVFDVVRQSDGGVVAVGRKVNLARGDWSQFAVFRLQSNGQIDTTFGTSGVFTLADPKPGDWDGGMSAVLDPDQRVVIAGSKAGQLIVLRLLPDGSLDNSFGTLGIFTGPENHDPPSDSPGARTSILRTAAGGYRVSVSNSNGCQIIALTAVGAIDVTFGAAGVVTVNTPVGPSAYCSSTVSQPDGRLLIAGNADGKGFAARLLANGEQDAGFSAAAVSAAMTQATAVAAGNDGSVVVAGVGISGTTIMRLHADGELDALFGRAGSTVIDIRSAFGSASAVHDMLVRADGGVVAAGGDSRSSTAFVARLLGAGGGESPGVLGITEQSSIRTAEGRGEVVVRVRRTGGADGSVSVAYETAEQTGPVSAAAGTDFGRVSGLLSWGDGDIAEQQIRVPIMTDNSGEGQEFFRVTLRDSQGGAGLGTTGVTVQIDADGGPFGQFNFQFNSRPGISLPAEGGSAQLMVDRAFYSSGAVAVTVTPITGSAAAGADFVADPITLTWADGERGPKVARIPVVDDTETEAGEEFTVQLSNPIGGAVLGPVSTARVLIAPSDQVASAPSGGGGAFDFLSLLLLGLLRTIRRFTVGSSTIERAGSDR